MYGERILFEVAAAAAMIKVFFDYEKINCAKS